MNRQAELNKEQADYSTDLAKNYWDYTNFENSVKHLKKSGLNPALYYAKGGQGGSTGGGQAQGVGLPSTTPTMARKQAYRDWETDRKSTRLNSSHRSLSRMPSSA